MHSPPWTPSHLQAVSTSLACPGVCCSQTSMGSRSGPPAVWERGRSTAIWGRGCGKNIYKVAFRVCNLQQMRRERICFLGFCHGGGGVQGHFILLASGREGDQAVREVSMTQLRTKPLGGGDILGRTWEGWPGERGRKRGKKLSYCPQGGWGSCVSPSSHGCHAPSPLPTPRGTNGSHISCYNMAVSLGGHLNDGTTPIANCGISVIFAEEITTPFWRLLNNTDVSRMGPGLMISQLLQCGSVISATGSDPRTTELLPASGPQHSLFPLCLS